MLKEQPSISQDGDDELTYSESVDVESIALQIDFEKCQLVRNITNFIRYHEKYSECIPMSSNICLIEEIPQHQVALEGIQNRPS